MRFPGIPPVAFLLLALSPFCRAEPAGIRVTSPDFAPGGAIPARFTCQGENVSPTLNIAGVPPSARSLVLIVDDPDAPSGTFTHWLIWNIPPDTRTLRAGALPSSAIEGTNDFGTAGYSGPCPPSGTHRYYFDVIALDTILHVPAGATRANLVPATHGHVIASGVLMGRYAKTGSQ